MHDLGDALFAVDQSGLGGRIPLEPFVVVLLGETFLSNDQGAKAFNGQILTRLVDCGALAGPHGGLHDDFGALEVEDDLSRLPLLEDDAHALRVGGEGEVGEHFVVLLRPSRVRNLDQVLVPLD